MITLHDIQPIPLAEMPNGIHSSSQAFGTDVHFEQGKKYLVRAASGKGKSTLLHIIYGLRKDFYGGLHINGQDSAAIKLDEWADLRKDTLSIVFQDLRLFPDLTARQNLELKASLTDATSMSQLVEMCHELGVESLLDKKVTTLSYGQRQRIAIIRALAQPFKFLLLDEPFSHLDALNIQKACKLIENACQMHQAGMILVSLGESYPLKYDHELIL